MLSVSLGAFSPQGFRVIKKKCVLGHIDVKCQVKSQGTRKQLLFNPITLVQTMKDTKAVMCLDDKSLFQRPKTILWLAGRWQGGKLSYSFGGSKTEK